MPSVRSLRYSVRDRMTIRFHQGEINRCPFAVSKCISDDAFSMVEAFDVKNYCRHKGMDFLSFVGEKYQAPVLMTCCMSRQVRLLWKR